MDPTVVVVSAIKSEASSIGDLLRSAGYTPCIIHHLGGLEAAVVTHDCMAVLLDLDSFQVSNRDVRQLTIKFPRVCFLCTSARPFHPELEDAISVDFYACIQKPVNPDELLYWLKCIHYNMEEKHDTS